MRYYKVSSTYGEFCEICGKEKAESNDDSFCYECQSRLKNYELIDKKVSYKKSRNAGTN